MTDAALLRTTQERLGSRHTVLAVATLTPSGDRYAVQGAPEQAGFEIGSISKGLTGLLYRDAVERGEISPETRLADVLPLADTACGSVTLGSLATHSSGLPSLPKAAHPWRRTATYLLHASNPYGDSLETLLAQARSVRVGSRRHRYSNLGFQLLGHAVAAGVGTTYATLLRERLADPLGITLRVPESAADLVPEDLLGSTRRGRQSAPWTGEGLGPAGGIRASIAAMTTLTRALLDGRAAGLSALDPVENYAGPAARIGAGWMVIDVRGRAVTWHNGGTGGFRTWLGMDRGACTGAVVLSARAISVDRAGFSLLESLG